MGKTIEKLATKAGHEIVSRMTSSDAGNWDVLKGADVAIEFTHPEAAPANIKACLERQLPVVIGTTGWYDQLSGIIKQTEQKNGSLLYASNFSIGVNLFMEINRALAAMINDQPQFNVRMSETHHTEKRDAPSGTAITLAEDIIRQIDRKSQWVKAAEETPGDLEIISHREPGVYGTHEITYDSEIDEIELIHRAKSREGFAQGALAAAEWLHNKKGVYTMKDVLNLNQRS